MPLNLGFLKETLRCPPRAVFHFEKSTLKQNLNTFYKRMQSQYFVCNSISGSTLFKDNTETADLHYLFN